VLVSRCSSASAVKPETTIKSGVERTNSAAEAFWRSTSPATVRCSILLIQAATRTTYSQGKSHALYKWDSDLPDGYVNWEFQTRVCRPITVGDKHSNRLQHAMELKSQCETTLRDMRRWRLGGATPHQALKTRQTQWKGFRDTSSVSGPSFWL